MPAPRRAHCIFWLSALLSLQAGTACAQPVRPLSDGASTSPQRPEPRIEHIQHEDAGSRIEELRIGGESRQITVQPKGAAPAYEVPPQGHNRNPAASERERSGSGGWKILGF